MRELLFLVLALFTALPAFSQGQKYEFGPDGALAAMNDGGDGTGVWLAGWFQDRKGEIRQSAGLGKPSAYLVEGSGRDKKPVVLINSDIKGRTDGYRYYAPLLAREIAELIHIGMAESAEKRYMILACSAEVFFELWGTRSELPVFSGVRDEELGAQVSIWVENDPDGGAAEISRRYGTPRLKALIEAAEQELGAAQAAGDGADLRPLEKKLAALRADKSYFDNEFKGREKYWWSMFQPR